MNELINWVYVNLAFHRYLDMLHKQKKKEMHLRMYNSGSDILLKSAHYSTKLQIAKINKNVKINKALSVQGELGVRFVI